MEERKTIFDYLGQVFSVFGFCIAILSVLGLMVGEEAREISSIFSLGKDGLSTATMMQFLGVSFCIMLFRTVFFTDGIVKRLSVMMRTVFMLLAVVAVIIGCAFLFQWFPTRLCDGMWQAWLGFFTSFGLCFAGSLVITRIKERTQNRKMEEALRRLKEQELWEAKAKES